MSHRDDDEEVGPNATIVAVLASMNRRHEAVLMLSLSLSSEAVDGLQRVAAVLS